MRGRIRILSWCVIFVALLMIVKLYSLQIIYGKDFTDKADRQYQNPTNSVFDRGNIYFQDKDGKLISAATLKTGFIVAINPKIFQSQNAIAGQSGYIDNAYSKLSAIIPLEKDVFYQKATKAKDTYEEVAKHVEDDKGQAIAKLKIKGLDVYKDRWRYYPGGELASQVLGFMAYKDNDLAGRYGLERQYDDVLSRNDKNMYVNFFAEVFSDINKTVVNGQSLEGDVVTTIEPTVQDTLQKMLKGVADKYQTDNVGGIVMNPKTGEIYAMAEYPSFDPNNFKDVNNPALFRNDLVESVHEMGSIIKPLTMSAGVDLGLVNAHTKYDDKGSVTLNGKTISNFDKKARGWIDLQTALAQSLNTGFVFIEQTIGKKNLADYFYKFGLGEKTGIDLPNEASGLVDSVLKSPRDIEYATASFGQGIAMTPIETARALAAVANGGFLVTPHLVSKINYRVGYSKDINPPLGTRVISESTSEQVTAMMVNNVDTSLLQGAGKNLHYSVAAKTGTAQISNPAGGYYDDRFLHSFVGFLPAYDPKIFVFFYAMNPHGVQYSSATWAQPFLDLTKFFINYYQLPPDR